jgi:hypothetical protein
MNPDFEDGPWDAGILCVFGFWWRRWAAQGPAVSATAIYTLTRSDAPYRSIDSAKLAAAGTARRIAREQPGKSVDIMLTAPDQRADKVNVTVQ